MTAGCSKNTERPQLPGQRLATIPDVVAVVNGATASLDTMFFVKLGAALPLLALVYCIKLLLGDPTTSNTCQEIIQVSFMIGRF